MQDGKIRSSDIIDSEGVKKEITAINTELKEVLKTIQQINKTSLNIKGGGNLKKSTSETLTLEERAAQLLERRTKAMQKEAELQKLINQGKGQELEEATKVTKELKTQNKVRAGDQRTIDTQARINNYYQQQSKELNRLKNRYKALALKKEQGIQLTQKETKEFSRLGVQVRKLDRQLKKVDATTGDFRRNVGNYASALRPAIAGLRQFVGAFGLTSGIYLFASALKDSVRLIANFDQAQADLAAILGKSKKEIGELTKQAKVLGTVTAFTASEISDLQLELAKLGFVEDEILAATRGVENLALATGVKAARAAELAGAAVRGFALDASEANRVAAALAVSTTKSANTFASLEIALPKVSSLANAFGFTIEDTSALLGGLANAGFEASVQGTSLRNIFIRLANDSSKLSVALGGPAQNFDELIEKFQKLEAEGVDLARAFALTDRRSVAAFKTFLQNTDQLTELRDSLINVEDELQKIADTKLDSLKGDLILLNSAWEALNISIEDGNGSVSKFFRLFITGATETLKLLKSINQSFNENLADDRALAFDSSLNSARSYYNELARLGKDATKEARELNKELLRIDVERLRQRTYVLDQELLEAEKARNEAVGFYNRIEATFAGSLLKSLSPAIRQSTSDVEAKNRVLALYEARLKAVEEAYGRILKQEEERKKSKDPEPKFAEGSLNYYKDQIKTFQEAQGNLATTTKAYKEYERDIEAMQRKINALVTQTGTVEYYEAEIAMLKKLQKQYPTNSQSYQDLEVTIKRLQEEIRKLTQEYDTLAYWEQEISRLRKEQEGAKTSEEWEAWASYIDKAREAYEKLKQELFGVTGSPDGLNPEEWQGAFNVIQEIAKASDIEMDPEVLLRANADAAVKNLEDELDRKRQAELNYTQFLSEQYMVRSEAAQEFLRNLQGAISVIFDARIDAIDREIAKENEKYDSILAREDLTEKQRKALEEEKIKREEALRQKKNKEAKKQDKANKAFAVSQIIIEAAKAKMTALTGPPYGAGILGSLFFPFILANAALQTAAVLAAPPPQFFKGTEHAPKGWAWTDEQGPEVHLDRFGAIKDFGSDQGPRLKYLEQGDKILRADKSRDFLKQIEGVTNDEIMGQIYHQHDSRNAFILANQTLSTHGIENRLDKVNRNIAKLASRPVVFKGNINMNQSYNKYN